jgi:hypothetical protein
MSRLTERCRDVYDADDCAVPDALPAQWLQARTAGNVLMFVDTQFSEDHR